KRPSRRCALDSTQGEQHERRKQDHDDRAADEGAHHDLGEGHGRAIAVPRALAADHEEAKENRRRDLAPARLLFPGRGVLPAHARMIADGTIFTPSSPRKPGPKVLRIWQIGITLSSCTAPFP